MTTSPTIRRQTIATPVLEVFQRSSSNLHNWNFLNSKSDEEDDEDTHVRKILKARHEHIPPRDLVEIILSDQEQWEKLQMAMRNNKSIRSTISLKGNLHALLRERIQDIKHGEDNANPTFHV